MSGFELVTSFAPTGDQPAAINKLVAGFRSGMKAQTLLGVTGSGKTFTMANIIANLQRPTLILAHNKTLAGQLCAEFRAFFPKNAVEYFVSYYDYYQPEAYIAATDTYIEKDSAINDEIDRLRHSATASLLERRDVIVVASVSCIYGLGSPFNYKHLMLHLRPGMKKDRDQLIDDLVSIQYQRNDFEMKRGCFRVRGDSIDIFPVSTDELFIRVSFFDMEIEQIQEFHRISGKKLASRSYVMLYPATHYATSMEKVLQVLPQIEEELEERLAILREEGKIVEAYRLEQRTRYDMQMLRETGFVKGIENYSRFLDERRPGEPPYTLLDFFPEDYLLFIDESHVTVPQIGAMYAGDRSRKSSLVDFGFRLPAAFDNRPLRFPEFEQRMGQTLFVSATPAQYERHESVQEVEQVIRPTGLLDPPIAIRPVEGQIEDLLASIQTVIRRGERALVLTLTKKMAEDLTAFLAEAGLLVRYLHSDIVNEERFQLLQDLRLGKFHVLVGINLLREGIDLPEVSLLAIMDADKEGFLRSTTSLIQIIGRVARNVNGEVIMYADKVTDSMLRAVEETNRRRAIQEAYNLEHGIVPRTIQKEIRAQLDTLAGEDAFITNLPNATKITTSDKEVSDKPVKSANRKSGSKLLNDLSLRKETDGANNELQRLLAGGEELTAEIFKLLQQTSLYGNMALEEEQWKKLAQKLSSKDADKLFAQVEAAMKKAATSLDFEEAGRLRTYFLILRQQTGMIK